MRLFITGTDTNIGKTYISCALLNFFNKQGLKTIGIKPIASGCEMTTEGLRNEDALALQHHANIKLPYELVNPIALAPQIAPHIAAQQINFDLSLQNILKHCQASLNTPADLHLIEGAGGWLVPLQDNKTVADFAVALDAEIILVVGMRLGCLNHALLTAEAIQKKGGKLKGWIANYLNKDMLVQTQNLETLKTLIKAPLLATMAYQGETLTVIHPIY